MFGLLGPRGVTRFLTTHDMMVADELYPSVEVGSITRNVFFVRAGLHWFASIGSACPTSHR